MMKLWLLLAVVLLIPLQSATAHHILGRPAYSLNEDSNTPPSMQGETLVGDFLLTYMVFPAFPRPGEPGRVHLYATAMAGSEPFADTVSFALRVDRWRGMGESVPLGVRRTDDHVFRQSFLAQEAGNYMIAASFELDGEPYVLDIPVRVGAPPLLGPPEVTASALLILLVAISLVQRRRLMTGKIRSARQ